MGSFQTITVIITLIFIEFTLCQLSRDKNELLNWCLNSRYHKHEPGKEDSLHKQCTPWEDHACCTENITLDVHEINLYNFTYDHCYEQTGRNMSQSCRKHFIQDNCFYHCEPHIGVWVVETKRKIASERFHKVPLCARDCEYWFADCRNDFTCAYNWPRDFKFSQGLNTCKDELKCMTFQDMYKTAKDFCENVWDESFKYTSDDKPCMHIWFDGPENPNKGVAEFYIDQYLNAGSSFSVCLWLISILLCFLLNCYIC